MAEQLTVCMVDDDASVRDALAVFLEVAGFDVLAFESGETFLEEADACATSQRVLVLDERLGGMSGLDVQAELKRRGVSIPIIFITGHGDRRMAQTALEQGAVSFLEKPFHHEDLLNSVRKAVGLLRAEQ